MPSNTLADLLAGKTPVAMYDALHAERLLSPGGLESPPAVIGLIQAVLRTSRRRPLERVAAALAQSGYLTQAGAGLQEQAT